jgi:hypothetical protein
LNTHLETWLLEKWNAVCASVGQRPLPGMRVSPPPSDWEAEYFLRALEDDLFQVDDRGQVASELLRSTVNPETEPQTYRLFSQEPPRLLRENLCQLATAARLIFEQGWLRRHVVLEPGAPEHHSSAGAFDLLVKSSSGEILVWVEVRRAAVELEKLVADLRACSRRGPHAQADCGFPQNHPRHQFCVAREPDYLWAVAPDGDICLAVKTNAGALELEPLPSLPPRSRLELS